MERKQKAKSVIESEVLPKANRKLEQRASEKSQVEYAVVEEAQTVGSRIGLTEGEVVYIAPVDIETGRLAEDQGLLSDLGLVGGDEQFQKDILDAFHKVSDSHPEDLFNVVAGQARAKVKVDPLISNM